ncbi:MAG: hypothetical protein NW207_01125 [Cytophagales bacterium]|nr:hypothetical protein [Cytophagales bacterium]
MIKHILICIVSCAVCITVLSQSGNIYYDDADVEKYTPVFSNVDDAPKKKIIYNPQNEYIKQKYDSVYQVNKRIKYMEGYRILIYSGTDKEEATHAKEYIYKTLPDADVYNVYKQPYYKVKLGDYTDRFKAKEILVKYISKAYPKAIIVNDNVLIKK